MIRSPAGEDSASIAAYLADVGRIPLLTAAEERELARRLREEGDRRAAHALVAGNLRFVVRVAREFRGHGLRMADLVQEGNVGLVRAVQRFDPARNVRLISYADAWIRASIRSYILRTWSLVKVGTTQAQIRIFFGLARARREVEREEATAGGGQPGGEERIAARLAVKPSEVREMQLRLAGRDLSLDAPLEVDRRDSLADHLADGAPSHDDELAAAEEHRLRAGMVARALSRLDRRERFVVEARLLRERPLSSREIGGRLGVSPERTRQLERRARRKLREAVGPLRAGQAETPARPGR